jgi:hypothetical protein
VSVHAAAVRVLLDDQLPMFKILISLEIFNTLILFNDHALTQREHTFLSYFTAL